MAELIWSPRAVTDLEETCGYIGRDSEYYARLFAQHLIAAVEKLVDFPEIGRVVPEYRQPSLRELLFQNYRIVYRLRTDVVEIVAVVHCARLLPDLVSG